MNSLGTDPFEIIKTLWKERSDTPLDLIHSLAGTENATVTDYFGRVVYEYFQNAVDRAKSSIRIELNTSQKRLIIANDGEPLSIKEKYDGHEMDDFHSICNIHLSSKEAGKSIGNKGVGFKSGWEFAEKITVVSTLEDKKKWGFRFHKKFSMAAIQGGDFWKKLSGDSSEAAKKIEAFVSKANILTALKSYNIPSFYFPEYIEDVSTVFDDPELNDFKTVIVLDVINDEKKFTFLKGKIEEFCKAQLFFVNQLRSTDGSKRKAAITVEVIIDKKNVAKNSTALEVTKNSMSLKNAKGWSIFSAEDILDDWQKTEKDLESLATGLSFNIQKPSLSIAFPPCQEQNSTAEENENGDKNLFYCYLPTTVRCGFNVLIHADFILDISRKTIGTDGNEYNKRLLCEAGKLLAQCLIKETELHKRQDIMSFLLPPEGNQGLECFVKSFKDEMGMFDKNKSCFRDFLKSIAENRPKTTNTDNKFYYDVLMVIDTYGSRPGKLWVEKWKEEVFMPFISHFQDAAIAVIPSDSTYSSIYPLKKDGEIFRRKDNTEIKGIDVFDSARFKGEFFISLWDGFDKCLKDSETRKNLKIVDWNLSEVIRRLSVNLKEFFRENAKVAVSEVILGFSPEKLIQMIDSIMFADSGRDGRDEPISFFVGKKENPTQKQNLSWIPVPVENNEWVPAFRAYYVSDEIIAKDLDKVMSSAEGKGLFKLDIERLKQILTSPDNTCDTNGILIKAMEFGVWPCLPLDMDNDPQCTKCKLPVELGKLDYDQKRSLLSVLVHSWGYIGRKKELITDIITELKDEKNRWFPLKPEYNLCGNDEDSFASPSLIFFAEKNDRSKPPFMKLHYSDNKNEAENILLSDLEITDIENSSPEKIILQIHEMYGFSEKNSHYTALQSMRGRYMTLMDILSKNDKSEKIKQLPLLVSKDGKREWLKDSNREEVWFVPRKFIPYKGFFAKELNFIELDPDLSEKWIKDKLCISIFEPMITPDNEKDLKPDAEFKSYLENNYLPYLILIAEMGRYGGARRTREDIMPVWNRLIIQKSKDIWQEIRLGKHERVVGKSIKKDVIAIQCHEHSGKVKNSGYVDYPEVWHDFDNPKDHLIYFGEAIATTVFGNTNFINDFSLFCLNRQDDSERRQAMYNYGVSDNDIEDIISFVKRNSISDVELERIAENLSKLINPGNPEEHKDELKKSWWNPIFYIGKTQLDHDKLVDAIKGILPPEAINGINLDPSQYNEARWKKCKEDIEEDLAIALKTEKFKHVEISRLVKIDLSKISSFSFDPKGYMTEILGTDFDVWLKNNKDSEEWLKAKININLDSGIKDPAAKIENLAHVTIQKQNTEQKQGGISEVINQNQRNEDSEKKSKQGAAAEEMLSITSAARLFKKNDSDKKVFWDKILAVWNKIPGIIKLRPDESQTLKAKLILPEECPKTLSEINDCLRVAGKFDGFGFDVIEIDEDMSIHLTEVKSALRGAIYLSENERRCAVLYSNQESKLWRMKAYVKGEHWVDLTDLILPLFKEAESNINDGELLVKEWEINLQVR